MHIKTSILIGLTTVILINCRPQTADQPKSTSEYSPNDSTALIADYQVPEFNDPDRLDKIAGTESSVEEIFDSFSADYHFPGYIYGVVVDDSLIFSRATGSNNITTKNPVDADTRFHIASMTKSFVAMAILRLRDEGKLSLDDRVDRYIPEYKNSLYLTTDSKKVTIRNLLTMTSGMPEDNPWADRQLEDTPEEMRALIEQGIHFSSTPGQYEYSNLGFALLGGIITEVSGTGYGEYITTNILQPLGMNDTFWEFSDIAAEELAQGYRWEEEQWKTEPMLHTGAFGAIGGLITSMNDFAKYVSYHLMAYPPRNDPESGPLKRSSVREMHQITAPRLILADDKCPVVAGYGYGLRITTDCRGVVKVGHSGGLPGFGSNYTFYPDYGVGIISFFNHTYSPATRVNDLALEAIFASGISPRTLTPSAILVQRRNELTEVLKDWKTPEGDAIFSENFYPDRSHRLRAAEYSDLLAAIGEIDSVGPIVPLNQLRGHFIIYGQKGNIRTFFTLDPTHAQRIQALSFRILGN